MAVPGFKTRGIYTNKWEGRHFPEKLATRKKQSPKRSSLPVVTNWQAIKTVLFGGAQKQTNPPPPQKKKKKHKKKNTPSGAVTADVYLNFSQASDVAFAGVPETTGRYHWLLPVLAGVPDRLWSRHMGALAGQREDPPAVDPEAVHAESGPVGLGGRHGLRRVRSLHSTWRRHSLPIDFEGVPRRCS